jgi:hypothetical protein
MTTWRSRSSRFLSIIAIISGDSDSPSFDHGSAVRVVRIVGPRMPRVLGGDQRRARGPLQAPDVRRRFLVFLEHDFHGDAVTRDNRDNDVSAGLALLD